MKAVFTFAALIGVVAAAPCSTDTDLFAHKANIEYATLASVSYHGYYKKLTITKADGTFWNAILVQDGCDAPTDVGNVSATITIPITSVAITDTTSIPFVELLGERPSIAAIGTSDAYVTSNCIHHQIEKNTTRVAYNSATYGPDAEIIKSTGVGAGATVTLAGAYSADVIVGAGINMLPMQEPYEPMALGSAEWMKVVAALYNKEDVAATAFAATVDRMNCGTTNVIDDGKEGKSRILWFTSYAGWGADASETITVGKCTSNVSPYYCEYADKVGATIVNYTELNILPNAQGSHNESQIAELCKHADYIFYQSDFPAMWEGRGLNGSAMADCSLIAEGKVYDMQAADAGGNAVFERRLSEPDLMLGDFANIVEQGIFTHVAKQPNAFLRNVLTDPVGGASDLINPACTTDAEAAGSLLAINRNCARTFFLAEQAIIFQQQQEDTSTASTAAVGTFVAMSALLVQTLFA